MSSDEAKPSVLDELFGAYDGSIGLGVQAILLVCMVLGFIATSWLWKKTKNEDSVSTSAQTLTKSGRKQGPPSGQKAKKVSAKEEAPPKKQDLPQDVQASTPSTGGDPASTIQKEVDSICKETPSGVKLSNGQTEAPLVTYVGREFSGNLHVNLFDPPISFREPFGEAMSISFSARWDAFNLRSRVVDFGCGANADNIVISNLERGRTLVVEVYRGPTKKRLLMPTALTLGETNLYLFNVSATGCMRMFRDGSQLGIQPGGYAPRVVDRTKLLVGGSNSQTDENFCGEIKNLKIWRGEVTWDEAFSHTADEAPTEAAEPLGFAEEDADSPPEKEQEEEVSERVAKLLAKKAERKARKAAELAEASSAPQVENIQKDVVETVTHPPDIDENEETKPHKPEETTSPEGGSSGSRAKLKPEPKEPPPEPPEAKEAASEDGKPQRKRREKPSWADIPPEGHVPVETDTTQKSEVPTSLLEAYKPSAKVELPSQLIDQEGFEIAASTKRAIRAKAQLRSEAIDQEAHKEAPSHLSGHTATPGGSSSSISWPKPDTKEQRAEASPKSAEIEVSSQRLSALAKGWSPSLRHQSEATVASQRHDANITPSLEENTADTASSLPPLSPLDKEILKLEKKQREVEKLRARRDQGEELAPNQLEKIDKAAELKQQIAGLHLQRALQKAEEFKQLQETGVAVDSLPEFAKEEHPTSSFIGRTPLRAPPKSGDTWKPAGVFISTKESPGQDIPLFPVEDRPKYKSFDGKNKMGKGKGKGSEVPFSMDGQPMPVMGQPVQQMVQMDLPLMSEFAVSADSGLQDRWECCWEWVQLGYCPRGEACRWEHPPMVPVDFGGGMAYFSSAAEGGHLAPMMHMVPAHCGPGGCQGCGPFADCSGPCGGPCGGPCAGSCGGPCGGVCASPCCGPCGGPCCSPCCGPCGGPCFGPCVGSCGGPFGGPCGGPPPLMFGGPCGDGCGHFGSPGNSPRPIAEPLIVPPDDAILDGPCSSL